MCGRGWRKVLALACLLIILAAAVPSAGAATPLPGPRYGTSGLWITDAQGRDLFLRGVDVTGAEDAATTASLPYSAADFKIMRADGVTVVRLPIAWANIEPERGVFDQAAIDRAVQIVDWAGAAGLRVVIDMHQYEWAPCFGGNGMPAWAVPDCPSTPPGTIAEVEADALVAQNAFWHSNALQEQFTEAWVRVAEALHHPYFLLGYDILNEPGQGLIPNEIFEQDYLAPFYRRVGTALRTVDPGGLLFVEPNVLNGEVNGSSQFLGPIGLPRVVYEPHQYGLVSLNADATPGVIDLAGPDQFIADLTIDTVVARRMDAALWLGEWGAINPAVSFRPTQYVNDDLTEQDAFMMSSAYWSYSSSLQGPDTAIGAALTRITPDAIAGQPQSIATGTTQSTLSWVSNGGQTLISFPASCTPVTTFTRGSGTAQVLATDYVSVVAPGGQATTVVVRCA